MNDLISIIVPIYSVENYLEKCINSIINQTYKNIEIILVDDGSPDKCGIICDEYAKKDKRIKVYHKTNGGLSDARNYGIEHANGIYYIFVDSDDFIKDNMVEKLYKIIVKDGSDLCICNRLEYYEYKKNNQYKESYVNSNKHLKLTSIEALKELASFTLFDMSAWAKIYKKELFDDIRFPVGKLSEDYYVMYKIFEKCKLISYINEPLYVYRQREGSISKNKTINYDYKTAAKEQMNYLENKYPELKLYVRTAYALANITIINWYIKNRNCMPSTKEYNELRNEVKANKKFIFNNDKISMSRKIQTILFLNNKNLYYIFYKIYLNKK